MDYPSSSEEDWCADYEIISIVRLECGRCGDDLELQYYVDGIVHCAMCQSFVCAKCAASRDLCESSQCVGLRILLARLFPVCVVSAIESFGPLLANTEP